MKILFFILILSLSFNQSFSIDQLFGQVNINDVQYEKPFLGGFNKPKIQWIDWDHDGYQDLLLF